MSDNSQSVKKRIPIPEPTKRRLLVECGHECTIPSCHEKANLEFHHINSNPLDNRDENLIVLCPNHHAMADRGKIDRKACMLYKEKLKQEGVPRPIALKELAQIEGIDVEPESFFRRWTIHFGRKYVNWRYGKLDVSLNREKVVLIVVGLLCFVPFAYQMYQLYTAKVVADMVSSLFSMLLIGVGIGLISILFVLEKLQCPNCSRNFGIRRTDSKRVEEKEVFRTETAMEIETLYRNTYECEFCGYKVSKFESVSETIDLT